MAEKIEITGGAIQRLVDYADDGFVDQLAEAESARYTHAGADDDEIQAANDEADERIEDIDGAEQIARLLSKHADAVAALLNTLESSYQRKGRRKPTHGDGSLPHGVLTVPS